MPSFTWLDYSERERRSAMDLVDLFREEDTVDELGLGTIRDAFADTFFPGTSTIQTRARYFLFIPWIFLELERKGASSSEFAKESRRLQDRLRKALVAGGEQNGVIGFRAGADVQRLPSGVYWQGLKRWHILQFSGTESDYSRDVDAFYKRWNIQQEEASSVEKGEAGEPEPRRWDPSRPDPPDNWLGSTTFQLTPKESQYLSERVQSRYPRSLMAFILRKGEPIPENAALPWEHPGVQASNTDLAVQLNHAKCFSETMCVAALLYNLILAEQIKRTEYVDSYRGRIAEWHKYFQDDRHAKEDWNLTVFQEIAQKLGATRGVPTWEFIRSWIQIIREADSVDKIVDLPAARELIKERERRLKGSRSRIDNPRALETWNGSSGANQMDYRWNRPVRGIINELLGVEVVHA